MGMLHWLPMLKYASNSPYQIIRTKSLFWGWQINRCQLYMLNVHIHQPSKRSWSMNPFVARWFLGPDFTSSINEASFPMPLPLSTCSLQQLMHVHFYINKMFSKCFWQFGKHLYVMVRRLPNRFISDCSGYFRCLCMVYWFEFIWTSKCEIFHS